MGLVRRRGEAVPEMWWVAPRCVGRGTRLEWEHCVLGREGPDDVMPLMVMKALLGGGVASWSLLRAVFRPEGGVSSRPLATGVATDTQRPGSQQLASW